jgi:hypothetical protein
LNEYRHGNHSTLSSGFAEPSFIQLSSPLLSTYRNEMPQPESRAAVDRRLDPGNASVTLQTLSRAAHAVGRDLRIELV